MLGKVLDFLFGKRNDIFDAEGKVHHKLPDTKWENWKKRYTTEPQYNWRNHEGMKAGKKSAEH
ncbi:MAG: hypothetical protein KDD61_14255 [Bdellovibrionales bacterium]|nr:hypothetical protein [Bdellovibrionales bacterium]